MSGVLQRFNPLPVFHAYNILLNVTQRDSIYCELARFFLKYILRNVISDLEEKHFMARLN